jgi:dimethylhistidine N-methyltransferase
MAARAGDMARRLGPRCAVIEYGSGSGRKTRILIRALEPVAYVPIDIAREQLRATAAGFASEFPGLAVMAVCADYSRPLALPELEGFEARRRIIYFPGSTIGNLSVSEAAVFLANARGLAGAGGGMLIGVDLKKDAARLNAAYNDARGITAEFNLNLLRRINRELGADIDLERFRHKAFFNRAQHRIEMHVESRVAQNVLVCDRVIAFASGETIHTESSYKYTVESFQALAAQAGWSPAAVWTDPKGYFSLHALHRA